MSKTYVLKSVDDIRKVPVNKRAQCMRELEYAFLLADLADAGESEGYEWTDDGDMSSELRNLDGKPVLALEVGKAGQE